MEIKKIPFESILPCWQILWQDRKSQIRPMSSMLYKGGYNIAIYDLYTPTFFALYIDDKIIGVNSGHKTSEEFYRSRGLWIDPEYRGNNYSQLLLDATNDQAIIENCTHTWTIPRESSLKAYEKNGFVQTSEFFNEGVEFGPNCYALKVL